MLTHQPMNRVRDDLNKVFDLFGFNPTQRGNRIAYPLLNLWEEDETLTLQAEVPGLNLEDLEIFVSEGNRLHIKGERKEPQINENGVWHHREMGYGKFEREVTLPLDVDAEKVEAKLVQGVLTITLPKSEAMKPRRIEIKSS